MSSHDLPTMPADAGAAIFRPLGLLRAVAGGAGYFVLTFSVGCMMGIVREIVVAPRITSDLAIVAEAPIMAWIVFHMARATARWFGVPTDAGSRMIMGSVAAGLLIWAENALSQALNARSIFEQWSLYGYLAAGASIASLAWFWLAPLVLGRRANR